MHIWHLTPGAPRTPDRVAPGRAVTLRIGTWPIEPGQAVDVEFSVTALDGTVTEGRTHASWSENRGANSYWSVSLGPFADGDFVRYRAVFAVAGQPASSRWTSFRVRPLIHLALVWHHHQPLYTAPANPRAPARFPWVRLHALRDYYGMAALAAAYPALHLTINFSPVLLEQLEAYAAGRATDHPLELTRTPTARLSSPARRELVETFFDAHWHHQVYPYPRYRELFERRLSGRRFSDRDLTDLRMWFNLAWFAVEFRTGTVRLGDGETCSVKRFIDHGEGFDERDIATMLEEQEKLLRHVVPLHRELQNRGQIEVSVTPFFHPILPLVMDTDAATTDRSGATRPRRFTRPEDAAAQVALAVAFYRERFGRAPRGLWPAEGAVSEAMTPLLLEHGIRWTASDEGVLAQSGRWGYRVDDPHLRCRPYRLPAAAGDAALAIVFRDHRLSDVIGFEYHAQEPEQAADAFVREVRAIGESLRGEEDYLLTIVLDGENPWGSYRDDGRPFLHALYGRLTAAEDIKTVTVAEYLDGDAERRLPPHPIREQSPVYELFTGSWIDEAGSAPGVDLGTWIGESEENAAWQLLGEVRDALEAAGATPRSHPDAFRAIYAAEGSDWFWWFGEDHQADSDQDFDELFRRHLAAACALAGIKAPAGIDRPVVPRRVLWTLGEPVGPIRPGDELVVRANCPGTLEWSLDGWRSVRWSSLVPAGGVMAGPGHYTASLGRLPSTGTLAVRLRCGHPRCRAETALCRGQELTVEVGPAR